MPFEARSVGQDTDFILVEMRLAVHDFQNHLPAASVGEPPVDGSDIPVKADNVKLRQGFNDLTDSRER